MINKITTSMGIHNNFNRVNYSPSFKMAHLNEDGLASADAFGYQTNTFLDNSLFKKQGIFSPSALTQKVDNNENFVQICQNYGCSNNGKANAQFIKTQILSGKSDETINNLHDNVRTEGLRLLFESNFDNRHLSTKDTFRLLEMLKDDMNKEDYYKYAGLLKLGTEK